MIITTKLIIIKICTNLNLIPILNCCSKRPKIGAPTNFDVRTKFEGFKRTNPIYDEKRLVGVGTKMQNPLFNPKEDSANTLYTATVKSWYNPSF